MTLNVESVLKQTENRVVDEFSRLKTIGAPILDRENSDAWNELNKFAFRLTHSKAPNVLNSDKISATRYVLLSNTKAVTLDKATPESEKKELELLAQRNELCYSGHSTLLYPSRLWQDWIKTDDLFNMVDLWLLTLGKRGCLNMLKTGAIGVAQAFILSLSASSYHDSHLEVNLGVSHLHREMSFMGIPVGPNHSYVTVQIFIDNDNRPYLEVSSTNTLYACDGGCLDEPLALGKVAVKFPVKITEPVTSILYIATSRKYLEQLRSAIHVSEVGMAPAHGNDVISLHKHGSKWGGLPTSFWVFLGIVLISFHAFLAKLLWSEWRKGDMTPYNPYFRNRYTYVRSH